MTGVGGITILRVSSLGIEGDAAVEHGTTSPVNIAEREAVTIVSYFNDHYTEKTRALACRSVPL